MSRVAAALDALDAEIQVIWGTGSVGVTAAMPSVVVTTTGGESRVHVSRDLPPRSRRAVAHAAPASRPTSASASALLRDLQAVLAPETGLHRRVVLSYDCSRPAGAVLPANARLVRAEDRTARLLRIEADWGQQSDWERLVDGEFPWSAATDGHRVLAICETARWSTEGVEAGVWTLPAARGHGLAAAVVSDWSASCVGRVPRVFYSTLVGNIASRRVAERLCLPSLGQLWYLTPDES